MPSTDSSGRSSNRRTTTQRVVENSDGALSSPRVAIVSWSAEVSLSSASVSWARTADRTWTIVRSARNSSGPVTRVTRPSTSDATGPAIAAASHVARTAGSGPGTGESTGDDVQTVVGHDRDVAVPVGASHGQSGLLDELQRGRRGMAVVVVPAHGYHREPGAQPAHQVGILPGAAVVGHLEHVDVQ